MSKVTLPFFGELDDAIILSNSDDCNHYDCKAIINGNNVNMDITCQQPISTEWSSKFEKLAANINKLDSKFYKLINKYADENEASDEHAETVAEFMEFHAEELDDDMLEIIMAQAKEEGKIASAIQLRRIGLYPDEENVMIWDYFFIDPNDKEAMKIGLSITDQILVIKSDMDGNIIHFAWES